MSAGSAMAILDAVNASGLGDLLKGAVSKVKDEKVLKMKASLSLISAIVDNMDEQGKCDGKHLIKELLDNKHIINSFDDEEYD